MTHVLLVRHATCASVGSLSGRTGGIALDTAGRDQARRVARALVRRRPSVVYASPLERTMETARAIGEACGAPVIACDALVEVDVGQWTGRTVASLDGEGVDAWRRYNAYRSGTRAPGGELQLEVQARVVAGLLDLARAHDGATIVAVTHAEIVRVALGHVLGVPIDLQHRLEIAPGSISEIRLDPWDAQVLGVNHLPPEGGST